MFAIGNEELEVLPVLLPEEHCPKCRKLLLVTYGRSVNLQTGEETESKTLAVVTCPDCSKTFLVGLYGKLL